MSDSSDHEPRPEFLRRLREAARRRVGPEPHAPPWSAGRPEPPAEPPPTLPALRGIEILGELGRGGMGTVHLARQIGLDRLVAVKLVWLGPADSTRNALLLARGPRAIASLSHPNVVQVHQVGKQDGWAYGVFEYVSGGDLKTALRAGPWSPARAASLSRTLAATVQFIHDRGWIHCDLKCSNILLDAGDAPKIADFGLVTPLDDQAAAMTGESGGVRGTPQYMAPEQADGRVGATGPAVDVHALGVILYELLTGQSPFLAPTREETLRRVVELAPPPPSSLRPTTPPALDAICLRCLQKEPGQRPTAGELAEDLSRYLNPDGPTRDELEAILGETEQSLYLGRLESAERALADGEPEAARAALLACSPERGRPDRRDGRWSGLWDRLD